MYAENSISITRLPLSPECAFQNICHLVFVDDILLLCQRDRSYVQILLEQLHVFGQSSGLHINTGKSFIYFGMELETVLRRVFSKILIFLNAASPSNTLVFLSVLIGSLLASFPLSCMNLNLLYKAGWAINYPMLYKFSLARCNFGSTFSQCPILSSTKLHAFARTSYGLVTQPEPSLP